MQKQVKDIGELKGKVLIFGGVYSNLQALQAMRSIAEDTGIPSSNIICTGDIVGYCAQPEECLKLVQEWGIQSIAGNVEIQLRERQDNCGCDFRDESRCDIFSRKWYNYAQQHVSEASLQWMKSLPDFLQFTYLGKSAMVVHGSYFETADFIFKSTPWQIKQKNFEQTAADIILSGHCGLPFAEVQQDKLWLNAGVIGMPANDGDARTWYAVIEPDVEDNVMYTFGRLPYDNSTASKLMNEHNLPVQYAKTLLDGIWDNCEILPAEETLAQGKSIII